MYTFTPNENKCQKYRGADTLFSYLIFSQYWTKSQKTFKTLDYLCGVYDCGTTLWLIALWLIEV